MKKITLSIFALLIGATSFAQVTLTHSASQNVVPVTTVACPTEPTRYLRTFDLTNEFAITDAFEISSVEFGVEISEVSGTVPINIYLSDDIDPTVAILTPIYTGIVVAGVADEGTVVSHTLTAPVTVPAGSIIAVEIAELVDGIVFRIGSNAAGETAESWLSSDACGAGSVSSFGFVNHYVMNVIGNTVLGVGENLADVAAIFPNPTSNVLNVKLPSNVQVTSATLVDALGRNTGATLVNGTMNTAALANGVYFLTVNTAENGSLTQKVVKQ